MSEELIGPRGKKNVRVAALIGAWGAISALGSLMAGLGEGDEISTMIKIGTTYILLLAILPIFVVLGAYVSAGFGEDPVEGIYFALASSVGGTILALLLGVIIFWIAGKGEFLDAVTHFLIPALIAAMIAIIGSSLRIIQDSKIEGLVENSQYASNDENKIVQDAAAIQLHAISSTISRQHEERIMQIESLLQGNRFKQLLYGHKLDEVGISDQKQEINLDDALGRL